MRKLVFVVSILLVAPAFAQSKPVAPAPAPAAKVPAKAAVAPKAQPETKAPVKVSEPKEAKKEAPKAEAKKQTWWQALIYDVVFNLLVPIFIPVLMALLYSLLRKWKVNIELNELNRYAGMATVYAERKAAKWLVENGEKSSGVQKEQWAWELIETLDAKLKGKKWVRDKLTGMILAGIPDAEEKVANSAAAKAEAKLIEADVAGSAAEVTDKAKAAVEAK